MEELSKQIAAMIRLQQTQFSEIQKQREEERKQMEEEKRQREAERFEEREERKRREEEREEERKQFNAQILEMQEQAKRKLEILSKVISKKDSRESDKDVFSQTAIWSALETFQYRPDEELTFEAYFRRFGDVFRIDCKTWSEQMKVRLLLQKLGAMEHSKFVDYILPKQTNELSFDEAVKSLMELYCPKTSLFHKRWKCINLTRKEDQDYTTFASVVNRHCDNFKLSSLTADNFKVLIFIQGLVSTKDAEIRRRALNTLEKEPDITLQKLAEECQRIISEKQDSRNIEEANVSYIKKVQNKKPFFPKSQVKTKRNTQETYQNKPDLPRYPCRGCGELHWQKDCPYRSRICDLCRRNSHKASHCRVKGPRKSYVKTMRILGKDENVRKYVIVKIGYKNVKLQLDSGSDLSIINYNTWCKIGKPKMRQTNRVAHSVTGERIRFEGEVTTNVTLKGKTLTLKMFVLKKSNNLFRTDWIQQFELWDSPMSDFCQKIDSPTAESKKLKEDLMESFPNVFSGKLGCCTKMKAKFELKDNITPVFKKKRSIPFASIQKIDSSRQEY